MLSACSIVARNYLPQARVLARSFLDLHHGGDFTLLVIDDETRAFDDRSEAFSCRRLADIGLSTKEIAQLASIYDVTELATSVKPVLLRQLISEGRDHILYLDPDIKVYDSLDDVAQLARRHGVVLTPHMTAPLPRDGRRVDDSHILGSGIYNLGFIGVGGKPDAFIDWWWSRTRREALVDPLHMMFTDQRWIDYVPSFFDHHIVKHPGYNVAYWNLHERELTWTGTRYLVDGQPLKFFHFSGYNVDAPHLLSKHQGDQPRILLSDRPALRRICGEYRSDLLRQGVGRQGLSYGWATLPSGLVFDRRMRRLYRHGLQAFEGGGAAEPPAPFESEANFNEWLNAPVAPLGQPRVSRYLYSIYQDRPDLQAAFPNLEGGDCSRYFTWLRGDGIVQEGIPRALLPARAATTAAASPAPAITESIREGVNLVGYFKAELGIGEAARLLHQAFNAANVPCCAIDYDATQSRRSHPFEIQDGVRPTHDVNVICVNADRTPGVVNQVGPQFLRGRYNVGYWFWELEQFPSPLHRAFDVVDEVWVATRFVADSVRRVGRRPVHVIPLALSTASTVAGLTRADLQLPSGFLFLFMFDFFSIIERKNPHGLVEAFKAAFRPNEGPTLVIKTINGDRRLGDLERLKVTAADRPDILIIDGYYSVEERNSLLNLCDCYVSLHRSEGLGLTMAEAMRLAKPVIATGYSGNMDFMTDENSYLVEYTAGVVPPGSDPYPSGGRWADPKLDHAAELMHRVYRAREEAARKAAVAQQDILTRHNLERSAAALSERLTAIRRSRGLAVGNGSKDSAAPATSEVQESAAPTSDGGAAPGQVPTPFVAPKRWLAQALRPYIRRQELDERLENGLRQATAAAEKAAAVEPHQRQALEAVWMAVHELEARLVEQQVQTDNLQQSSQLARLDAQNLTDVVGHQLATFGRSSAAFQDAAAAHLQALEAKLQQQSIDAQSIWQAAHHDRREALKLTTTVADRLTAFRLSSDAFQQAVAAHLSAIEDKLQRERASVDEWRNQIARDSSALAERSDHLQELIGGIANQIAHLRQSTETATATLRRQVSGDIGALEKLVTDTMSETTTLANRLYAAPYMAESDRFQMLDADGRRVLGYRSRSELVVGGYRGFEDIFRGTESFIRDRQRIYVPLLSPCVPVLEIGCGRGEMLDLLRDAGVSAIGTDLDGSMVDRCRSKGHDVECVDGLQYLNAQPDGSLGGIFAAQVVEHLSSEDFIALLRLSQTKLRQGGVLIFETVNPHAIESFKTFWTDLTHVRPIFPEVALAWCSLSGFARAEVLFPNGSRDLEVDRRTQGEYSVIATR